MKKVICIILFVVISLFSYMSVAEGLLPSLSETVGIAMPSLGEALQRYPDSETENDDGSITEIYTGVSETDFSAFSVYLEKQEAELADYHVEGSMLTAEIRAKDASFYLNYDTEGGEAKVTYPAGTFSEWMKNAKTHFVAGKKLLEEGKADEAYEEFLVIPQYSEYAPVANLLQIDDNLAAAAAREAKFAPFRTPGNTVAFGRYEQDNNTANGSEEIEWIVLEYDEANHRALLLSRYGLDAVPYNKIFAANITWEKCTLRAWLNGEFMKKAFTTEEQSAILVTDVDNSKSQGYSKWDTDGGNNTQDQIFLLSYAEANRYLNVTYDDKNNTGARVAPTAYAIANGALTGDYFYYQTADGEAVGWWWLRSPGIDRDSAAGVYVNGSLGAHDVGYDNEVVRPAFWIDLESEYFK